MDNTSTLPNPSNTYLETGEYIVTQSVGNPCFQDETYDTINVVIDQIKEENFKLVISINPNPGKGIFLISITSSVKIDIVDFAIFDLNGKMIKNDMIDFYNGHGQKYIDLSNLDNGIYVLKTIINEENVCEKLVIR